jgi:hypothetical protein
VRVFAKRLAARPLHHRLARVTDSSLPWFTRLWFSWACWLRVLFDGSFAARVFAVARAPEPLAEPAPAPVLPARTEPAPPAPEPASNGQPDTALQLLALLQREGRLVDFLQQDVSAFPDADVGAAARVVHEGCRRALRAHASVVSVRTEAEGAAVTVQEGELAELKLTGNVSGTAPYRGVLRHRGWRVESLKLPTRVGNQDLAVVAPAEVEL